MHISNTSLVEKRYTYLQMLAAKSRNHLSNENLRTLFLLTAPKLPEKYRYVYEQEVRFGEEKL